MSGFKRYLMYETNSNSQYIDYGEVVKIINDRLINVNVGGERDKDGNLVILEAVMVEGDYVPKLGDWVGIDWRNGQPVALGGNSNLSSGLININSNVKIVSQTDMANGVINSDHIRANSIQATHIQAQTIQAYHISANAITTQAISANAVSADKIAANAITTNTISANAVTTDKLASNSITTDKLAANSITSDRISANSIYGYHIVGEQISGNHIAANTIDAKKLTVSAREFGLLGQYFSYTSGGSNKFETFKGTRIDSVLNIDWGTGSPSIVGTNNYFAIRWQGLLFAPETGQYNFYLNADDGAKLWVDNQLVVDAWTGSAGIETGNIFSLNKDTWYTFRIDYYETTGNAKFYAKWKTPSMGTADFIPAMYLTQSQTIIDGGTILTNTITASAMKVGTINAASGIIADASITTALIANGSITTAKIGLGEIKTANIANANITTALIADASVSNAKIIDLDAAKISTGYLSADRIYAGTITGDKISGNSITGDKLAANSIDTLQLKAGAITTTKIAAGSITTDRIASNAISSDKIVAGSITANHISTIGLDAQIISVYNSKTGQTLIGSGYLRVDGLDVGVVQSDNLVANGLFLTSSPSYGLVRDNPNGEVLLGTQASAPGGHEIWKINISTGAVAAKIGVSAKNPYDIDIDSDGTYAYVSVQGDDSLKQIDLANNVLTGKSLPMGMGTGVLKYTGDALGDMKHIFVLDTDKDDMHIPDSLWVVDIPPHSVNHDFYTHHELVVGNGPYDFAIDSNKRVYVTLADQGDIAVLDASISPSMKWTVVDRIPISAFGTDNYHGGLPSQVGLGQVLGGDAAAAYDSSIGGMGGMGGMSMGAMTHDHGGYGSSDTTTMKKYTPHGIAVSADSDTLYVVDYANGELLVVDKYGKAPYNTLTGRHDVSGNSTMMMSGGMVMVMGNSPETTKTMGVDNGGGPTTNWVRYRISIGDSPDFIEVVNGKIFITLEGSGQVAVINESEIINAINADRVFYATWDTTKNMNPYPNINVRKINVGAKPGFMVVNKTIGVSGNVYVSINGQNQVKTIDISTETVTSTFNTGANPKGLTISKDGSHIYVVNNGGSGELSFIYPSGNYIGDPFLGLEGMVEYQGADFWVPNRSNWVKDASGNILASSTVEFRINEPFLNEGGYSKLTAQGTRYQYSQIEQDIYNVTNYSNGNNMVVATDERLSASNTGNTVFVARNEWISSPTPTFKINTLDISGNTISNVPSANTYTINYGSNANVTFSGGIVPSGGWVTSSYTGKNNLWFKPHNGSVLIAIENSSSPNFNTTFEIDEFIPKFVAVDNQQTSPFTPTADGINEQYTGLQYSTITNRAINKTISASSAPISGSAALSVIVDGLQPDELEGNTTGNAIPPFTYTTLPSGNQYVQIDLGLTYMIGSISVSHMYGADRVYHNTKTQVSEDGSTWTTVYDSSISGEYNENPLYHSTHGHTHYAKFINFDALPTRYIRDYANGWTSGNGLTSGSSNDWTEIKAYGDWQLEKGYVYPTNSQSAGLQIATNGKGIVTTDIKDAYVAMDIKIDFTSWWYMTYLVGPEFGSLKVEMPSLMNSSHFLFLDAPYINKVAHRHVMSFPPSINVKQDDTNSIKAGKHRVVIRQNSGKISFDRLRFEDFQYYNRSSLLVTNASAASFTRYKIISEQAKWFQGQGIQSTFGAYDTQRTNPDTGLPDKSIPIKYRFRVKSELNADGTKDERGIAYVTSAIMETGKLHTHWRPSAASDIVAGHRIQSWDGNQPHKTGIQSHHLANGAVKGSKILANAIMDYHISSYANIAEHKLALNYPTHDHSNKLFLDSITGFAGISGNYGTGNTVARADHTHDFLPSNGTANNANMVGGISANQLMRSDQNTSTSGILTVSGSAIKLAYAGANASIEIGNGSSSPILKMRSTGVEGWLYWNDAVDRFQFKNNTGSLMPIESSDIIISGNATVSGSANLNTLNVTGNSVQKAIKQQLMSTMNYYPNVVSDFQNATVSGGWIIHTPILRNSATMFKLRVHGYGYGQQSAIDATFVGYLYPSTVGSIDGISGSVISYSIADNGNDGLSKYVGVDSNGKLAVAIGDYGLSSYFYRMSVDAWITLNGNDYSTGWSIDRSTVANFGWKDIHGPLLSKQTTGDQVVSGNITITGTVDGVKVSTLNSNVTTISGNLSTLSGNVATISGNLATLSGNVNTTNSNVSTISGNINTVSNNVATNSGNISTLSGNISTVSGNLANLSGNYYAHVGSGGSAHALVIANGSAGFISGSDKSKLDNIQINAINQTTTDGRYLQLTGGVVSGVITVNTSSGDSFVNFQTNGSNMGKVRANTSGIMVISATGGSIYLRPNGDNIMTSEFIVSSGNITFGGNSVYHAGNFITGNYALVSNYYDKTTSDGRYLQLVGGTLSGSLTATSITSNGTVLYGISSSKGALNYDAGGGLITLEAQSANTNIDIKATGTGNVKINGNLVYHAGNFTPSNYATVSFVTGNYYDNTQIYTKTEVYAKTETYSKTETYNKSEVDGKVASSGDIRAANANTFTNANSFTNAGLAIKVQPSANVAASTKLIQVLSYDGLADMFIVDASGNVTVKGNLNVSGTTVSTASSTTTGNTTINGNLNVNGNSNLGAALTDTTIVNGMLTLTSGSVLKQQGVYKEVHRRPLFGIAGDMQFQTNDISFISFGSKVYTPTGLAAPSVPTGATRYYRVYAIYSDDITSAHVSGGQSITLRMAGDNGVNKDLTLSTTWGAVNDRRDWYSPYFTDIPNGTHITLQAKLAISGNNLGIRWVELMHYDMY